MVNLVHNNDGMEVINTHDAKTHLSRLLERVASGEEFLIARSGRPIARLVGLGEFAEPRSGGIWKGRVRIDDDFDAPLPEAIDRAFRGES